MDAKIIREFNVTGTCVPNKHYMVDISNKLEQIKAMIDKELYFTINRGRQYGKTTTLSALRRFLTDDYTVILLSFEGMGVESFINEETFCQTLLNKISLALRFSSASKDYRHEWLNPAVKNINSLNDHVTDMCEDKKLVLMIDEVDKISNNRVFLDFLSMLRAKYLARQDEMDFTFHSVILAGVYDIRNIKLKLIQEGLHTATGINNSPWNVASDFDVSMTFSVVEIETMLQEYENDHKTGMNMTEIAEEIYDFTNGYPVLVSRICKLIDEKLEKTWKVQGVRDAVKLLLKDNSPLFESLFKNLESNPDLSDLIYSILMRGERWTFTFASSAISLGVRYGYLKDVKGRVKIANKIFEMIIANYFIHKEQLEELKSNFAPTGLYTNIIENNRFNMQRCLEKFAQYYH